MDTFFMHSLEMALNLELFRRLYKVFRLKRKFYSYLHPSVFLIEYCNDNLICKPISFPSFHLQTNIYTRLSLDVKLFEIVSKVFFSFNT